MRVLIVDDEYQKIERIGSILEAVLGEDLVLLHRSTAYDGRVAIRTEPVDMLIVDLHLPSIAGAPPSSDGGINFYRMLQLDKEAQLPLDTVFLTAKDGLVDQVRQVVEGYGARLCRFDESDETWQATIRGIATNAKLRLDRARTIEPCDIGVITALRTPELEAVLNLAYQWEEHRRPDDPTIYHLGRDDGARGFRIVAACAQRKGMASSAALASRICSLFRPRYLFMLGICAGIPGKSKMGDVVVADPVWDWGSGKNAKQDGGSVFLYSPYQHGLDSAIAQACSELARTSALTSTIRGDWDKNLPEGTLAVHLGPMATGASVIADEESVRAIAVQNRDIIAIDMEGYAVMAAAEYTTNPKIKSIVIKSVCDFADASKDNRWQSYASYTSAKFFDCLIKSPRFEPS